MSSFMIIIIIFLKSIRQMGVIRFQHPEGGGEDNHHF